MKRLSCSAIALAVLTCAGVARADPQWNLALTFGGGARWQRGNTPDGLFAMGARGDVLFGPRTPYAARVGPFVSVRTDDVDDLVLAAGLSAQLPLSVDFPLIVSVGGVAGALPEPVRAGVLGRVAWGPRSYNDHGAYVMAGSVWVEARYFPGDGGGDVIAGVDLDLRLLTIPVVILYEYLRGAR